MINYTTEYLDELDDLDSSAPQRHQRKGKRVKRNLKSSNAPTEGPSRPDPAESLGSETPFEP
ncbi:MAG TPA: hypothetical protein VF478_07035, partial [Anaerolineae bacterium]